MPAMRARDALGPLFTDEQFAELFAARGRPAWSPARLALVLVLQFVEGLTDRQAADAVRARLDWKYALDRMEAGAWLVGWRLELTRSVWWTPKMRALPSRWESDATSQTVLSAGVQG